MDYASLAAAFPAAIVAAVAGSPQGLTTTGQVYVADVARVPTSSVVEAWVRPDPEAPAPAEETLGGILAVYRFHVLLYGDGLSDTALRALANGVRSYFHGALPSTLSAVTDLVAFNVEDWVADEHPGKTGGAACSLVLDAIGKEWPA